MELAVMTILNLWLVGCISQWIGKLRNFRVVRSYKNGTYLYGLLMLAFEHYAKGKNSIPAIMKDRYYVAMVNLRTLTQCKHQNMAEVCEHCYYYKQLKQFVEFAMNQD
ncbi:hypothetical protein Bca4012_010269 [Brassica carinata]